MPSCVAEEGSEPLICLQGIRLAARTVEGHHELLPASLTQRIL